MDLWNNVPGICLEKPVIEFYEAKNKQTDAAVIIFPGGGYSMRAEHEGKGYASFLNAYGVNAFVCHYRVAPHRHPLPLMDARRSVQWVRYHAEKYGVDPRRLAVMGSSAGGHLAACLCTCQAEAQPDKPDEIDQMDYLPNAQILCYPVIGLKGFGHVGSGQNLLGEQFENETLLQSLEAHLNVHENTPQAFLWHTADDPVVNIENSLEYAKALRRNKIDVELHVFPNGPHGIGTAEQYPHDAQWTSLLKNYLEYIGFLTNQSI